MSRDSSRSYIHLHSSRHADLFDEFTSPPSTTTINASASSAHASVQIHPTTLTQPSSLVTNPMSIPLAPGHTNLLPSEDIPIPAQYQPLNPEDEDDVVPDQHAAFGITRAMAAREGRDRAWRDFGGLGGLVRGDNLGTSGGTGSNSTNAWTGTRLR